MMLDKNLEMTEREKLLSAAARGYCHPRNASKEIDHDLIVAIVDEILPIWETRLEGDRMRLAAISTAAIGYWKEGQEILPEYDTPALRDVARLFSKYEIEQKHVLAYRNRMGEIFRKRAFLPGVIAFKYTIALVIATIAIGVSRICRLDEEAEKAAEWWLRL